LLGLREGICSGNGGKRTANSFARYGDRIPGVNPCGLRVLCTCQYVLPRPERLWSGGNALAGTMPKMHATTKLTLSRESNSKYAVACGINQGLCFTKLETMAGGIQIDRTTAARAFGAAYFNLLRRGANGSLTLSSDHWQLEAATEELFRFVAREADAPLLELRVDQVERFEWDRLPRQQVRSQIRVYLSSGDLWTFSGSVDESVLPAI
jgi:hypothetical protein